MSTKTMISVSDRNALAAQFTAAALTGILSSNDALAFNDSNASRKAVGIGTMVAAEFISAMGIEIASN